MADDRNGSNEEAANWPPALRRRPNLILIGMPGAGKSTLGRDLAQCLGMAWLDTDLLIETRAGAPLQQLIDHQGLDRFRQLEEDALLSLRCTRTVIATGGSVVYSEAGMTHLRSLGVVVWLDIPLAALHQRIHNLGQRGLVMQPGQDLAGLYAERLPLYRRWAEVCTRCDNCSAEQTLARLLEDLTRLPHHR